MQGPDKLRSWADLPHPPDDETGCERLELAISTTIETAGDFDKAYPNVGAIAQQRPNYISRRSRASRKQFN